MMAEALSSPNSSSDLDENDLVCGICLEFYSDTNRLLKFLIRHYRDCAKCLQVSTAL